MGKGTVAVRLSDEVLLQIDDAAESEEVSRSIFLRRLIDRGLEEWKLKRSLENYTARRWSIGRAARECGLGIMEFLQIMEERRIPFQYDMSDLDPYLST